MPGNTDRRMLADLGVLATLIALPSLPLIAWRCAPLSFEVGPVAVVAAYWLVLLAVWLRTTPAIPAFSVPAEDGGRASERVGRFVRPALAVLLLLLTLLAFYLPLRFNFWGGVDEFPSFESAYTTAWSNCWDEALGRPLVGLPSFVATRLMPQRIEGFLFVAVFLCFANGWLLFLLLSRLMPRATAAPVLAAVFLIVHRADPLRFFVMWASNHYETVLFLLLLASWLFLLSYERQSRALLVLACAVLGCALLSSESAYPSVALIPVLGLAVRRDWKRYSVWVFAWYGTVALLAARFVYYLLTKGGTSYQSGHFNELLQKPGLLLSVLTYQFRPALTYFTPSGSWAGYVGYAAGAFGLVVVSVLTVRRSLAGERINPRAVVLAAVAVSCGLLPFLPLGMNWSRTQFLVAPAEATLLAFGFVFCARALPARVGAVAVAIAGGLLAANATVAAVRTQERYPTSVRFERTVSLFRQVHGISPSFVPDTLLVFVLEHPDHSPLGYNYAVAPLARDILGVDAIQANYNDPYHSVLRFNADHVISTDGRQDRKYRYDQIVAFRVKDNGSAVLLRQLPPELLPGPKIVVGYDPVARMRPGPFAELPFLRYPAWSPPLGDVVLPEDGLMLGDGWSPLIAEGSDAYRVATDGAELVVNPQGGSRRQLSLELEPRPGSGIAGSGIELRDNSGAVVAAAPLTERGIVHLTLPLDAERVSLFRLFVRPPPGSAAMALAPGRARVRAFRRGDATQFAPLLEDIFRDGLMPGRGWHALENAEGKRFHWVGGDAEVDLGFYSGAAPELALVVEAGPGSDGKPCALEVRDESDRIVANRVFRSREELRIPVPPGYSGRLRLHVNGGGAMIANDPRVLNYRVFACGAGRP